MGLEKHNRTTQPQIIHRVFNNWDVIPKGWYFLFECKEVAPGAVRSVYIGKQKLVVYRTMSGKVRVVDSFCPHMGADLAVGGVVGENLRCFFHHWEYGETGKCVHIPCQEEIPKRAFVRSYAVCEKYGAIWVYPDEVPGRPLLEMPGLEGGDVIASIGKPNVSKSHHHISMINGIDPQHLKSVHQLSLEMGINVSEERTHIEFILEGDTPTNTLLEKFVRLMLGKRYSYGMKYADACFAGLTVMRNVYFLREKWRWPELHMFYAYRPGPDQLSYTFPIYVAKRETGFWGGLKCRLKLWMMKQFYFVLKGDDDIIYENIRYNPTCLLPMDSPVTRYLAYVNRLEPSVWSVATKEIKSGN